MPRTTLARVQAIVLDSPGGPEQLRPAEVPDPRPGPGEVLIEVAAAGVNRADLMQREGRYPPPPGAPESLGLECSGTIRAVGDHVSGWSVGDQVCALLAGGGYAGLVAVDAGSVLPRPDRVSLRDAAALPEVGATVWSNLVLTAGLRSGQTVLIHGGGSGIGTMAIQVAHALGARVVVTASRDETLTRCTELGADVTINYTTDDFSEVVGRLGGADVVLDVVGAPYLARNIAALADGGRVVIIGMQGGSRGELDLSRLLAKRGGVLATALRSRPVTGPGSKAAIVASMREQLWPMIAAGKVVPIVDTTFPLERVGDAHRRMEQGGHFGKILLDVASTTGASATKATTTNTKETPR